MLFRFLILSFGFVFTHRIIEFQMRMNPLSEAISMRIARIQILFFLFLTILSAWTSTAVLIFFLIVPNLAAARLDRVLNLILRHQFQQKLCAFVDELVLLMMTGKSFRDSFLQLTQNSNNFFQKKLRELFELGHLKTESKKIKYKEFQSVTELVQFIEKNPHRALDKLKAFRRQLYWSILFKRKTKQATTQIRSQAIILSLLYVGLLIFVCRSNEGSILPLILPSLGLFLTGLIIIYYLGRQRKWKT